MLIQQTLPPEYENLTRILVSSTDKTYINKRVGKVKFYADNFEYLIKLIESILRLDKEKKFLLKYEKKFLKFALNIFRSNNKSVKIKDYVTLLDYSFYAVVERIIKIQKELVHIIKKSKLKVSDFDNEYLFALQNILNQVESLCDEINKFKWDDRNILMSISRKTQLVYTNLHEVVMSIALNQSGDIKSLSDTILDSLKIEFHTTNKILA